MAYDRITGWTGNLCKRISTIITTTALPLMEVHGKVEMSPSEVRCKK